MGIGDWGLGIGDWGLGIGPNPQSPIPWFKKEKREENIALGREMLLQEIKKQKYSPSILDEAEAVEAAAKKLSYRTAEDLIAGVGYGGITSLRALNRIREELSESSQTAEPVNPVEAVMEKTAHPKEPPSSGIIVEGIASCLVKFAKCCTPVPGDDIVGFVTRGYGVSVHRRDCKNVEKLLNGGEAERLVGVRWHVPPNATFPASICVTAVDRFGLLADIANIIANMRVAISGMNAKAAQNSCVDLYFAVNVSDREQLESVMKRINAVRSVVEVKRNAF